MDAHNHCTFSVLIFLWWTTAIKTTAFEWTHGHQLAADLMNRTILSIHPVSSFHGPHGNPVCLPPSLCVWMMIDSFCRTAWGVAKCFAAALWPMQKSLDLYAYCFALIHIRHPHYVSGVTYHSARCQFECFGFVNECWKLNHLKVKKKTKLKIVYTENVVSGHRS